jgi:ketosteroid isomerase-like protein
MKTIINFSLPLLLFMLLISSCEEAHTQVIADESNVDIINDQFPEAQDEIKAVLDGIFKSLQEKDADKLISYHIYGPKFTEFRDAARRFNSEENEEHERGLIGAISGFDYNLGDLAINVFGDVAVVTFHADFRPTIGGDVVQIWELTTLVFVKVNGDWKITHEHHSPLNEG